MKRTISDIEQEMFDVQERIDEIFKNASSLNKKLRELRDKLHLLKEEKFEAVYNINKGDIIQDENGVQYYYQGISKEWANNPLLVSKITKKGLPSKNTMHVWRDKFRFGNNQTNGLKTNLTTK